MTDKLTAIMKDYISRRETINRLREQMPEIHRHISYLKSIIEIEVGPTVVMHVHVTNAEESLSKISNAIAHEEQKIVDIYKCFSDSEKKTIQNEINNE